IEELLRGAAEGAPPRGRTAAFTVDDGYLEQATVAAPIFAEFDCPATVFVATGFLDGRLWLWWDQVSYVFRRTRRLRLVLEMGDREVSYATGGSGERARAEGDFVARCKALPEEERARAVEALAREAGVEIPFQPPAGYLPM